MSTRMPVGGNELYDFFAQLGQAVHAIQAVEGSLHQVLSLKLHLQRQPHNNDQASEVLEKYRKMPLGGLITIAKREGIFSSNLLLALERLNTERRWLIHRLQEDTHLTFRSDPNVRLITSQRVSQLAEAAYGANKSICDELLETMPAEILNSTAFRAALSKNLNEGGFLT